MEIINRYASEVGILLPRKKRADIEAEIKSTLEDMLEERSSSDQDLDRDLIVLDLLKEYGPPDKVAASYGAEQYLIGPSYFPYFLKVIKIVGVILIIMALLGFSFRLGFAGLSLGSVTSQFFTSLSELWTSVLTAFGIIVLIFTILERTLPQSAKLRDLDYKEWDPKELKKKPRSNEVRISSEIEGILFNVIALVIFNVFPQVLSVRFLQDSSWVVLPVLSERFFQLLPWIDIIWVLGIFLNLLLIYQKRKTWFTYITEMVLKVFGISIAIILLTGPAIITLSAEVLTGFAIPGETAEVLINIINIIVVIAIINFILVSIFEIGKTIYKLAYKRVLSN
ncbi:hypothetical protein ACFLXB_01680 [Chloroflexota bacterium]